MKTLIISVVVSLFFNITYAQSVLYVSPEGCDTNTGAKESPLKSIDVAKRMATKLSGSDTIHIYIASGEYMLSQSIDFTGGELKRPLKFSGDKNKPTIVGGIKIEGWQPYKNGIWRAFVPQSKTYGFHFEQFYVNDKRAVRAKTPNDNNFNFVKAGSEQIHYMGTGRTGAYATQKIVVSPEELSDLKGMTSEQLQDVLLMFYHKWDVTRKPIDYVAIDSGFIYTNGGAMHSWNQITSGSRYIIENYMGALDSEGEWFLSRDGWLYYMPLKGEDMTSVSCYAPVVKQFITIKGSESLPVTGLTFENISFKVASYATPRFGNEPMQAAADIDAAVMVDYASDINFVDCEFSHTGGCGIWMRRECFNSSIERCHLNDLGAGGIKIGETQIRDEGRSHTNNITINNNIIHHGGYVFPCGVGVSIFQASDIKVTHNEISDLRYSGVSIGWKWGYNDTKVWTASTDNPDGKIEFVETMVTSPAVRNTVAFNHIHHIGWCELSDMGAVYTLGESPGTVVSNNVIHDIYSYDYGGWGLYTDEGSTDIAMENNLVYRCKSGGFHQHYGKENIIQNNIFAFGHYYQLQFTRVESHKSFDFKHNIILRDRGETVAGAWKEANIDMDYNLYWDITTDKVLFGGLSLGEWQKIKDAHSMVVDPLFNDPQNEDFTFKSLKNVKKIGFKPFDYSKAGVYGSSEWMQKAILSQDIIAKFAKAVEKNSLK